MTSTIIVNTFLFNMHENHDWVDNKLERRYGTTQYNRAIQDYITTMEPLDIFANINYMNDYVTYATPFFGEEYYNCDLDNEFEIEDNRNQMDFEEEEDDNQIDIEEEDDDEVELDPRELIMEFDEAEFEQGMYINYDDNVYVGSYKYF